MGKLRARVRERGDAMLTKWSAIVATAIVILALVLVAAG